METYWRIEMLGQMRAVSHDREITRFRTQKTACLLAYLAHHLDRPHPREVLIETLWPESDPDVSRTSLRQALFSLRCQLEPPGIPHGSVLHSDRSTVRLNPAAVTVDVDEFRSLLKRAKAVPDGRDHRSLLEQAVDIYRGELLPGFYEDWIVREQDILFQDYTAAVRDLTGILEARGERQEAVETVRKGLLVYPDCRELQEDLRRLTAPPGGMSAAPMRRAPPPAPPLPPATAPYRVASAGNPVSSRGYLPPPLTRFFGRDGEMQRLRDLLQDPSVRLVTLTGPGGSGKTRLALEVARGLVDAFAGGIWFVPLANLSDPGRILDAILGALDLPRLADVPPVDQIALVLSGERALLVLDNFEHLVDGGAEVAGQLLLRLPSLLLLVTSRRVLSLSGEREFPVRPLPVPHVEESPESLVTVPSVQLFLDRAQCVRPDFQVTEGNEQAVSAIVSRLEGIPLALELAAARSTLTPPSRMLSELEHRFDVLVSRYRDAEPRHQTMSAAIAWSYRLLPAELQRFFRRLSVFRGGWTVEAAEVVCEEPRAACYLEELRQMSLVLVDDVAPGVRFQMLETLREYAAGEMTEAERWEAQRRHRDDCLALTQQAGPELPGARQQHWFDRLDAEHDNLRAALAFCREDPEGAEPGMIMAGTLGAYWSWRGYIQEGWERLRAAMAHPNACPETAGWAMAITGAAHLGWHVFEPGLSNTENIERAIDILRRTGPAWALAWALLHLGGTCTPADPRNGRALEEALALAREDNLTAFVARALDRLAHMEMDLYREASSTDDLAADHQAAADALWQEALEFARRTGDLDMQANILCDLAEMHNGLGDAKRAREYYEETLSISQRLGNTFDLTWILLLAANFLRESGEYPRAEALYREAEAICRSSGSVSTLMRVLDGLGNAAREQGDYKAARRCYEEQKHHLERNGPLGDSLLLHNLGRLSAMEGDVKSGRAMLRQALEINRAGGNRTMEANNLLVLGNTARREGELAEARSLLTECLCIWSREGPKHFVAYALEAFACLCEAEGEHTRSVRLYGAAAALRKAIRKEMQPEDRPEHEAAIARARGAMTDDQFAAAWAEGWAMCLEATITYALKAAPESPSASIAADI